MESAKTKFSKFYGKDTFKCEIMEKELPLKLCKIILFSVCVPTSPLTQTSQHFILMVKVYVMYYLFSDYLK